MASSAAEEKAMQLEEKAEKKLNGMFSFGSGKYEDAAEFYGMAGAQYKLGKKYIKAGDAYRKQSENFEQVQSALESAMALNEAAHGYKRESAEDAIQCLLQCVDIYNDQGRFGTSAKLQKEMAEIYETEEKWAECVKAYETAADLFQNEEQTGMRSGYYQVTLDAGGPPVNGTHFLGRRAAAAEREERAEEAQTKGGGSRRQRSGAARLVPRGGL